MKSLKKILVPVDLFNDPAHILQLAIRFARTFGAEIYVMFVHIAIADYFCEHSCLSEPDSCTSEELAATIHKNLEAKMLQLLQDNLDADISYRSEILYGDVVEKIIESATKNGVDLIVIGTHSYNKYLKFFIGSVTSKVMQLASCPVLSCRPFNN